MTFRRVAALVLLVCAWVISIPAAGRYMSVDEIRPGMTGTGRTVFDGSAIDEFKVHILGVLRRTISPRRDLILARLEGGPLARTGVIAGMSGSPVYIDGRMIGAVAYSLGSFPTEAIAGITPIGEMIDAARLPVDRVPAAPVAVPGRITADTWWDILRSTPAAAGPFAAAASDVRALHAAELDASLATALRPIATPVSLAGLTGSAAALLLETLGRAGFVATPAAGGQTAPSVPPGPGILRPGDSVGVTLVSGDYLVGATGTVTEVDGDRVYALGHPFFGLGPTRLPMTRAFVHAILPSLASSTKIASTGDVIGTFGQDRATVLAGTLGPGPETIPVTLTLTNQQGQRRELRVSLIEDQFFTPLLGFVTVGATLSAFERDIGANTYGVRGRITVRGQAPVEINDVFTGDAAASGAAAAVSVPLAALLTNDRERVRIESVTLDVVSAERTSSTAIERVWIDAVETRPGRSVPLKILLRPYRGPDEVRTLNLDIPVNAEGPLTIVVADAARITEYEERDGRIKAPAPSLGQLIGQLNRVKRGNRLYVRVYTKDAGATVAGESLPALPNSILAIIEGDRAGSGTSSFGGAVIASWDIPVDRVVTGSRTLTIRPMPVARQP